MYPLAIYLTAVFLAGLWAVLPPFWFLFRKQLPSNKIHALDIVLQDADDIFRSGVEGGLLDAVVAAHINARLIALHKRAHPLRLRAFQTTILWEDLTHMRRSLSHEMARLIKDARSVCARISAVSYVKLQDMRLRTIDGKEAAQLGGGVTGEAQLKFVPAPLIKSALFSVDASADLDSTEKADGKVLDKMLHV